MRIEKNISYGIISLSNTKAPLLVFVMLKFSFLRGSFHLSLLHETHASTSKVHLANQARKSSYRDQLFEKFSLPRLNARSSRIFLCPKPSLNQLTRHKTSTLDFDFSSAKKKKALTFQTYQNKLKSTETSTFILDFNFFSYQN